jgi:hypothetical protein
MFGAIAAGFAAYGYGSRLARKLKVEGNWGERGLLGLFALAAIATALHFFFALSNPWIRFPVVVAGCALATFEFHKPSRQQAMLLGGCAVIAVFCWLQPMNFQPSYDTGLYHLQSVRWNLDSPITPGLANLHGRLGFNSTLFLLEALLDIESTHWLVNYLTAVFVLIAFALRMPHPFAIAAVSAFFAVPKIVNWLGVTDADRMISALVVYCVLLMILEETTLLLLLATLAVTVKVFAAPVWVAAFFFVWRNGSLRKPATILAVLTLAMFGVRGLFLSGCAVYPAGFTCLSSLPWAVLPVQARWDDLCIRAWGRDAADPDFLRVLSSWDWFPQWRSEFLRDPQALFAICGCIAGYVALRVWKRGPNPAAAISVAGALAFWFFTAPGIRYGQCFLIAAGILGLSRLPWRREYMAAIATVMLAWAFWNRPAKMLVTIPDVSAYQTSAGIWMPKTPERCWNHAVPCTPYLDEAQLQRIHWRMELPLSQEPGHVPPQGWMMLPAYRINPLTAE